MKINIGITMRVTLASGYHEPRDSIAQDWPIYFDNVFPDSTYFFIPNIKGKVSDYLDRLNVDVLFLSGGDDIGVYPDRDETEIEVIKYCLENNIPLIGICRGLQLVNMFLGGGLIELNRKEDLLHSASKHIVEYHGEEFLVNSFHSNVIDDKLLSKEIEILAKCKLDQTIEAFRYRNILALMWHPERDDLPVEWVTNIIYNHINGKRN